MAMSTTTDKTTTTKRESDVDENAPTLAELDLPAGEDAVTCVSRWANGKPRQSDGFVLLIRSGASDVEKAAAWNKGGEQPDEGRVRYYREV
jgi:hypothetical protein